MTEEVIKKLLDKATVLTAERKKRGKQVPEDLVKGEDIRGYKQVASHPVSTVPHNFETAFVCYSLLKFLGHMQSIAVIIYK